MNGHSAEYEIAMGLYDAELYRHQEQPEWYTLMVNGTDVLVDTSSTCERYALEHYSLTNDQYDQLCDEGWVTSSADDHIEIVAVDGREERDGE